jgi:hypothetical protein
MIKEILDMRMIPAIVLNVLYGVCVILKLTPNSQNVRVMLKKKDLIQLVRSIRATDINQSSHLLLDKYIHRNELNTLEVMKHSIAASIFCQWIVEIHRLDAHFLLHDAQNKPN